MDSPTDEPEAASTKQRMSGSKAWMIAGLVGLVLIGVIGGVFVANRGSSPGSSRSISGSSSGPTSPSDSRVTAAWMRGGCDAWAQSADGTTGPTSAWCSSMATWMAANGWGGASGQGAPMMGSMMGGNAEAMRSACEAWRNTSSATTTASTDWCDQMADWMLSNWDRWDRWDGSMMDGN